MSSGGGKGGKETVQAEIPEYIKQASMRNINRGENQAAVGYMPWYGPDVAAQNPHEKAASQGAGSAMEAFGLAPQGTDWNAGMPQEQTFAGGVKGYSSAPQFLEALGTLQQQNPAQMQQFNQQYASPTIGGAPNASVGQLTPEQISQMWAQFEAYQKANPAITNPASKAGRKGNAFTRAAEDLADPADKLH